MMTTVRAPRLRRGGHAPAFVLPSTTGGEMGPGRLRSRYNMVLAFVAAGPAGEAYLRALAGIDLAVRQEKARLLAVVPSALAGAQELAAEHGLNFPLLADEDGDTTRRMIGADGNALCVADRFGEIYFLATASSPAELPKPDVALEWLEYIELQCPE